ncbi:MAG TPA: ribosomal L7Ae/L30e/S12e/Gadd45 family protein, partial [Savagea sp.]
RKIVSGEDTVVRDVRAGRAALVLMATDASDNTKKKLADKCNSYNVPLIEWGTRYEIGHAIGKEARVTVAIAERKLAAKLIQLLNE